MAALANWWCGRTKEISIKLERRSKYGLRQWLAKLAKI